MKKQQLEIHSKLSGNSIIVRKSKQRNMTRTPTGAKLKRQERELTRKDSARRRKQRSRAVASAQVAESTMLEEAVAATATPIGNINTMSIVNGIVFS